MKSVLSLAIVVVTILLVAFAERLGLPGALASVLVQLALGAFVLALVVLSATSRLTVFLDGDRRTAWFGQVALQVALLGGTLTLLNGAQLGDPLPGLALLAGYACGVLVAPARQDFSTLPSPDRALSGGDTAGFFGLASAGAAVLLLMTLFSPLMTLLAGRLGISGDLLRLLALGVIGTAVILGGYAACSRLSRGVLALVAVFIGVPLGLDGLARSISIEPGLQALGEIRPMLTALADAAATRADLFTPALMGLGLALVGLALMPGRKGPAGRLGVALPALALVTAMAVLLFREVWELDRFVSQSIRPLAPAEWPLFVFDEALQGWLRVCGVIPRDATDVAQACGLANPRAVVAGARLQVSRELLGPAMAGMRGWPILFGYVWGILGPLLALIAVSAFLHVAATGMAETLIFRVLKPRQLRSGRLATARLLAIAALLALAQGIAEAFSLDAPLTAWLALSFAMLAGASLLASWLLILRRVLTRFLASRQPTVSEPSDTASPAAT